MRDWYFITIYWIFKVFAFIVVTNPMTNNLMPKKIREKVSDLVA
jgi:hypothetical protein